MERFSPKIEIINHFDNLINRINIDIDSSLEIYNDKQLLGHIVKSSEKNRRDFKDSYFDTIDSSKQYVESWPESMKVIDYLKQIRMKTIEELKKAQEEILDYYKLNSDRFKSELNKEKNIEELKSELFAEKFYFQVNLKQSEKRLWPFNVFTFVTDFYMSQSNIDSFEKFINEKICGHSVFDDEMVLTALLFKFFAINLLDFPNHVIHVCKQDALNIDFTHNYSGVNLTSFSTTFYSKLVNLNVICRKDEYCGESIEYKIEGLLSLKKLHLEANTSKVYLSIKNLPSLTHFSFSFSRSIDENIVTELLDQVTHIQELHLNGILCYFNLDHLVNLKVISVNGIINENFNLELFKNLCNRIEDIKICICNINEKILFKLFDGYKFPYLVDFTIRCLNMKRLTKEFINRLPMHKQLNIIDCDIEVIESDSFSNMQQLTSLDLSGNEIEFIEENAFSNLKNLQKLNLSYNNLTNFDRKFVGLRELVEVKIEKSY